MKIRPFDSAHHPPYGVRRAHHEYQRPHHHAVPEASCADKRPSCDDFTRGSRDACEFPRLRFGEFLRRENLRDPDPGAWGRAPHRGDRRAFDRRQPECDRAHFDPCAHRPHHHDGAPAIGDAPSCARPRQVERVVQTYVIRALTPAGSRIDFFA